jgi:L-alanine-DL-glutamate epimerase-like enolase superfamily enzyme
MILINAYKFNFKLLSPISISFHTWYYRENILVKLKWKNFEGWGEAAPFKPVSGDNQTEVIKELKRLKFLPFDPEKDSFKTLHYFLSKKLKSQTTKAAIDFAYHDLIGKIKKLPVNKLHYPKAKLVPNSVTIFIQDSPANTAKEAKRIYKKYPHLKILKIKLAGKDDFGRVEAIKRVSPKKMKFTLDANQAFKKPQEAVSALSKIGKILKRVILVEEPCPKGELDKLKYVKNNLKKIMVFADESAATLKDVNKLIKAKAVDGVNIKLQKAGGIWPAKQIALACQKAGLKIMIGSMLEGPLAITAGVHFAVSTPNLILSDLDMDLDMPKHTWGEAGFKEGKRIPTKNYGLGVSFNMDKIKQMQKNKTLIFERIL